ncbi:MAG: hypothetical protein HYZ34_12350 [Ignavibacteriae bacterium]|nr:hypothetical protein [Ignavibacteriota bacterium]
MFKKRVRVSNSSKQEEFFEEEFWVDTGALYSFVPEDYLKKINIEPVGTRSLILADGRQDTRLLGFCNFQIESLEGIIPCPVIFWTTELALSPWRNSVGKFWCGC